MATVRLDSSSNALPWAVGPAEASLVLRDCQLLDDGRVVKTFDDVLDALQWLDDERRQDDRSTWVGSFGYELGAIFEPAARHRESRLPRTPLLVFAKVSPDRSNMPKAAASPRLAAGSDGLRAAGSQRPARLSTWQSTFGRNEYLAAVARCVEYIAAGDVFQVNLAQSLSRQVTLDAAALYDRLPPATFGGMIDLGDVAIVSNSPELFLHVDATGRVETRPIKGTRPAGTTHGELLGSEKDAAELNMIVDLERNDLGRVCEIGSVRVASPRSIELHPTVQHGVATVVGQLRQDVGLVELLAATFPSGSVTGAPKIRAMQIIDELEPSPRGPYCGAMGRLDADGSILLNVAIRTATLVNGVLHVPVGGGIVADSVPAEEYAETIVKARAFLDAAD